MRIIAALSVALMLGAAPAWAESKPLQFQAAFPPYQIRVVLHFPAGAGREQEAVCSTAQVELFRDYFQRYVTRGSAGIIAEFEAAQGAATGRKVVKLDFQVSCHADGGATITNYTPEQRFATQYYDPATGKWGIVG